MLPTPNNHPTKILFQNKGIVVTATTISSEEDSNNTIITLHLNRQHEKNVINPTMTHLLSDALDIITNYEGHKSLLVTGLPPVTQAAAQPSTFFSNGLDLNWFTSSSPESRPIMIESFCSSILARLLVLPMRTIAVINGHCIGAGLFIALACDYRIMHSERGFLSWPEVRLGMRLTKGFAELSKAKIGPKVWREGILNATMYDAKMAKDAGIVDEIYPLDALYGKALELAVEGLPERLGLDSFEEGMLSEVKMELFTDAYRALKFGKVENLPYSRI